MGYRLNRAEDRDLPFQFLDTRPEYLITALQLTQLLYKPEVFRCAPVAVLEQTFHTRMHLAKSGGKVAHG